MKTAKYPLRDGTTLEVEYDENAPCIVCGEPVIAASMGGTVICPWCDCGNCRYCGIQLPWGFGKQETDHKIKEHMAWHKANPTVGDQ